MSKLKRWGGMGILNPRKLPEAMCHGCTFKPRMFREDSSPISNEYAEFQEHIPMSFFFFVLRLNRANKHPFIVQHDVMYPDLLSADLSKTDLMED
jgi:hypothetical protein